MEPRTKGNVLVRSVLGGIGIAVLFLVARTVLDYIITQALSQFVIADCSEDCYFRIFNLIFALVAIISLMVGIRSGVRMYRRLAE